MQMNLICRGYDWQYSTISSKRLTKVTQFTHQLPNLICRGYSYKNTNSLQPIERVSHGINWRYLLYLAS